MVSKGEGSIQQFDGRTWVYIPKAITENTSFPFEKGDKVLIEIKNGEIIVRVIEVKS